MNAPTWLWWLIGTLVLLGVLYLVGVRMKLSTGHDVGAVPVQVTTAGHGFIAW